MINAIENKMMLNKNVEKLLLNDTVRYKILQFLKRLINFIIRNCILRFVINL